MQMASDGYQVTSNKFHFDILYHQMCDRSRDTHAGFTDPTISGLYYIILVRSLV